MGISIVELAAWFDRADLFVWLPGLGWSIWSLIPRGWHIPSGADM